MSLNENFIQATETLINSSVSKLRFDKTIRAKISKVIDINQGIYTVEYQGGFLTVYSLNARNIYKVNDEVYVKIPEGDLSNKKFIEDRNYGEKTLTDIELNQLKNYVYPISPNFISPSGTNQQSGLTAGDFNSESDLAKEELRKLGTSVILYDKNSSLSDNTISVDNLNFGWYSNNFNILRISAKFQTNFYSLFSQGVYGLQFTFVDSNGENFIYDFNTKDFNGNEYQFTVPSEQTLQLELKKGYLTEISKIVFYQKDFPSYDQRETVDAQGESIHQEISETKNIFVKDIAVEFLEKKDLSTIPFFLRIKAPYGHILGTKTLILEPELINNGDIVPIEKCLWFERDDTVTSNENIGYNKDAGVGWKEINEETLLEGNALKISPSALITYEKKFKIVVLYKGMTFTTETSVLKADAAFNLSIVQKSLGTITKLSLKGKNGATDISDQLVGDWYILLNDGTGNNYRKINSPDKIAEIDITPYLNYMTSTFMCDIYHMENGKVKYLTTKKYSLQLEKPQSNDKYFALFNGPALFRYDADGNIGTKEYTSSHTLELVLELLSGNGRAFDRNKVSIAWYLNGQELSETKEPVTIENCMIQTYQYVKGSQSADSSLDMNDHIVYTIRRRFNKEMAKAIFTIEVTDLETNSIDKFEKEIIFLETGDQGTNNSPYSVKVVPTESNEISKVQYLLYRSGEKAWDANKNIELEAKVYDNKTQTEISANSYSCKWSQRIIRDNSINKNVLTLSGTAGKQVTISPPGGNDYQDPEIFRIISVEVNINGVILYYHYPIPVLITNADGKVKKESVLNKIDIVNSIKYNASGEDPQYRKPDEVDTTAIEFIKDKKIQYQAPKMQDNSKEPTSYSLIDKNNFSIIDPPKKILLDMYPYSGVLIILNSGAELNETIVYPIILYLNVYGNESINGWDGLKLEIDKEKGQYLFAPQVGAGEKNLNGAFTGVVMGKDSAEEKIGLYGYKAGINTFALKDDGTATLGAPGKGQIIIDGDKSEIKSSTWETNKSGTYFNLSDGKFIMKTLDEVHYSPISLDEKSYVSGEYYIKENGKYVLSQGKYENTVKYYKKINGFIALDAGDNIPLNINENFYVEWDGTLHATGAILEGYASLSVTDDKITTAVKNSETGMESTIKQTEKDLTVAIKGVDDKYATVKMTVDGLTVTTQNGVTIIDGGNINTSNLNLSGVITFDDLNSDTQKTIEGKLSNLNSYGISQTSMSTEIGSCYIWSPTIQGDKITATDCFKAAYSEGTAGYFGYATGKDANGKPTYGVALIAGDNRPTDLAVPEEVEYQNKETLSNRSYLITTNGGVRMTKGNTSVVVTGKSATMSYFQPKISSMEGTGSYSAIRVTRDKCEYKNDGEEWKPIGGGDGKIVAVWG